MKNCEILEKMKNERLNEISYNKNKTPMKIIEYNNNLNIIVEFQDKYKAKVHTNYSAFLKGNVKNPFDKRVVGVGCIGIGKYNKKDNIKIYETWQQMLIRCYDPYNLNKLPTYRDVEVCEEWHNFQNFAKWYEENVYECNGEKLHLDKDILYKRNKIYSPDTCVLAPQRINLLFMKANKSRKNVAIGCNKRKNGKYQVNCSICKNGKRETIYLGSFDNEMDAFNVYKTFKENYIKEIADEYKDLIPNKLYDAMYKYEVEIND
jgi:hypothetical protein